MTSVSEKTPPIDPSTSDIQEGKLSIHDGIYSPLDLQRVAEMYRQEILVNLKRFEIFGIQQ